MLVLLSLHSFKKHETNVNLTPFLSVASLYFKRRWLSKCKHASCKHHLPVEGFHFLSSVFEIEPRASSVRGKCSEPNSQPYFHPLELSIRKKQKGIFYLKDSIYKGKQIHQRISDTLILKDCCPSVTKGYFHHWAVPPTILHTPEGSEKGVLAPCLSFPRVSN